MEQAIKASVQLREAASGDAAALASLSRELGYPTDAATILRRMNDMAGRGAVLVAVDPHGAVCGFAQVEPRRLLIAAPFVELTAMVVSEAARGSGAGATLLAGVESWACAHGFASVRVRSNALRERAHRFYLREGYIEKKRQAVFLKRL